MNWRLVVIFLQLLLQSQSKRSRRLPHEVALRNSCLAAQGWLSPSGQKLKEQRPSLMAADPG
jgi:hypothetical protein